MRKIFIDIGGWDGTSAEFFRKTHDLGEEFEIFTFECDKNNIEKIKKRNVRTYLIEKAAWSSDGKIKYYYGNNDGGTLYSSKTTGNIHPENLCSTMPDASQSSQWMYHRQSNRRSAGRARDTRRKT